MPRLVQTSKGNRILQNARATVGFWDFWNRHHDILGPAGYTIKMDSFGQWWVRKWTLPVDEFNDSVVPSWIKSKLLFWQAKPTAWMMKSVGLRQFTLDASEAGTGKTAVTCATSASLRRPMFVVCKKYAKPGWRWMAQRMGADMKLLANWELIRKGNTDFGKWSEYPVQLKTKVKMVPYFQWSPEIRKQNGILVMDEFQTAGGIDTQNSSMAMSTRRCGITTIGLSATVANSPTRMKALAYLTRMIHSPDQFKAWALRHGCVFKGRNQMKFGDSSDINSHAKRQAVMLDLHQRIFGSGMAIRVLKKDIPNFPRNHVTVEAIDCDDAIEQINREYQSIKSALDRIAARKMDAEDAKKLVTHSRQQIELLKIPAIVEMVEDEIENGRQVVVFVNYRATAIELGKALGVPIMLGSQSEREREEVMLRFQDGTNKATISTYGAGSDSINLQDEVGDAPRTTILFPTFRVEFIIQGMNRTHRATAKSPTIQRFIYAWGTMEQDTMDRMRVGISHMDLLNDGASLPLPNEVLDCAT